MIKKFLTMTTFLSLLGTYITAMEEREKRPLEEPQKSSKEFSELIERIVQQIVRNNGNLDESIQRFKHYVQDELNIQQIDLIHEDALEVIINFLARKSKNTPYIVAQKLGVNLISLKKIPTEIKELIARSLVNAVSNEGEALQLREDLKNLSQVNREFRAIVNSGSFIRYVINALANKLRIIYFDAAALLATSQAVQWLKGQNPRMELIDNALYCRVIKGDYLGVKFLFAIGANLKGLYGEVVLITAARYGYYELVKFLLTKNPDQEAKNEALACAVNSFAQTEKEIKNMVQILIESGADVNAIHHETWRRPLKLARERKLNEVAEMLEQAGAY